MSSTRRRPIERARPLERRPGRRQPRRTILIICEGERTEPDYLNALKREGWVREQAAIDLRVESGRGRSSPSELVNRAINARDDDALRGGELDEVWCVFDVEDPRSNPRLPDIVKEAERRGIKLAISNPCFEVWLILHFRDHTSWIDVHNAIERRRELDDSKGKEVDPKKYMQCVRDAVERARALDDRHRLSGTRFPDNNPSSGMYLLIDSIDR